VWQGAWHVVNISNLRGVNTILIHPFNCSVQESRQFDTHGSTDAATELSNYLSSMIMLLLHHNFRFILKSRSK